MPLLYNAREILSSLFAIRRRYPPGKIYNNSFNAKNYNSYFDMKYTK